MTGETSSILKDAQEKCKKMSATLPIIKSDSANNFILMLERVWVWFGMERKNGSMVWFDNTPAEVTSLRNVVVGSCAADYSPFNVEVLIIVT